MKLLAIPIVGAALALMIFPVVFATGDASPIGCTGIARLDATLATIRTIESGGDYASQHTGSSASGAYQFLDSTWAGYGGFPRAWQAPAATQDAKAIEQVQAIFQAHDGDVTAVPPIWYIGHVPADSSVEWDTVPYPGAGNVLTPREYQIRWITEYAKQVAAVGAGIVGCDGGGSVAPNADGYAIPGPADLFAAADVYAPHAQYPAWDWLIPVGTPIYAIRGGRVTTVQYWPRNWWDEGCGTNDTGCHTCGIGVTIIDADGNHWAYCHGTAAHAQEGQDITAGTQIITSGNTGRSGAPHVHIELHLPDGSRRCLGPLLASLKGVGPVPPVGALPSEGCFY